MRTRPRRTPQGALQRRTTRAARNATGKPGKLTFALCYRCGISGTICYDAGSRIGRMGCDDSSGRCVLSGGQCGVGFYQKAVVQAKGARALPEMNVKVTGAVLDDKGTPASGVDVRLFLPSGLVLATVTDSNGAFSYWLVHSRALKATPDVVELRPTRVEDVARHEFVPVFAYRA